MSKIYAVQGDSLPLVTLTTIGAKSGQLRSTPLVGIPDGERLVLVASNFGQGHHPAWYYNLVKNPSASVTIAGATRNYVAAAATGAVGRRCTFTRWATQKTTGPGVAL